MVYFISSFSLFLAVWVMASLLVPPKQHCLVSGRGNLSGIRFRIDFVVLLSEDHVGDMDIHLEFEWRPGQG